MKIRTEIKKAAVFSAAFLFSLNVYAQIVSLTPSGTEILCALGLEKKISGCTQFCNYPPSVSRIPVVGGFDGKTLSIEKILSLEPEFVYMSEDMHSYLVPQLKELGVKCYLSKVESIDDVYDEIIEVSKILGTEKRGRELVSQMKKDAALLKKQFAGKSEGGVKDKKTVYVQISSEPLIAFGKKSYMNDLLEICGAENVFDIEQSYPTVSLEEVALRNPDVIFLTSADERQIKAVYNSKILRETEAVKNKKVYALNDDVFLRYGTRMTEAAFRIGQMIYE